MADRVCPDCGLTARRHRHHACGHIQAELLTLRSNQREQGPGETLRAAATDVIWRLHDYVRHRPWCPESKGPADCTCGLYALLDSIRCECGHKVSIHTDRDVSDVVGWPCNECRSARCPKFLAALEADSNPQETER